MKINNKVITGKYFAFDGCHKIYIINSDKELEEARLADYDILDIDMLEDTFDNACPLKFISSWDLTISYVAQGEGACFEYE